MSKIEIIPAILPHVYGEIEDGVQYATGNVKTVQIDICDGQFTPTPTWPYYKRDDTFEKLTKEEVGLPFWENLNYEFDLMVNKPEEVVEDWVQVGGTRIILHAEARDGIEKAIKLLKGRVEVGVAFDIKTDAVAFLKTLEKSDCFPDFVQCMGIDNVGFQHQPFDNQVIEKIKTIKAAYPDLPISVDGGVSLETAQELIAAGATRLVVGSAIFGTDNPLEALLAFKNL